MRALLKTRLLCGSLLLIAIVIACSLIPRVDQATRSLCVAESWVANSILAGSLHDMFYYEPWLQTTPPGDIAQHYVATFDLRRRCALYLTYYRYGDTRKRGMAMLTFKAAYRSAGFEPTEDELPDYLPLVLDFAALHPRGESLLRAHRADLELLLRGLRQAGSPYASVIEAVCTVMPSLRKPDLAAVTKAWADGPPAEDVGLEPFAPPGYLTGTEASR